MAYEALDNLQQTLDQILNHYDHLIITHSVKQELLSIHLQAVVLQMNLKSFPEKERIREEANTTHEIIEYLFSEENLSDGGSIEPAVELTNKLRKLREKLESTVGDVLDYIKSEEKEESVDGEPPSPAVSSSSRAATTSSKDVVVGFDEDVKVIKDRLTKGSSKLRVLPIVGTGGIGKTTLAKIVYNYALSKLAFRSYAWVTMSQDYSVGSIALNLLASMKGLQAKRDVEREMPMESLICEYLCKRKYLIVIDDMCSKEAWDDVKALFPDSSNGSRIIVTTRLQDVAAYVVDSSSSIHMMCFLDARQSWDLLRQKVFADEDCPIELEDVGKRIATSCGGLPLLIVVAAGLLSKIHKTRYMWKKIAANDVQLETVIRLSYNHLPDYLGACFLYMAAFPEDYEIHVSELIKLWVAQGFVICGNRLKSLESQAEDCLEDLVERSLVLATSRKLDGKIKSCSLHDIVRDFCVRQAGKEKLILPVMDYLPSPILRSHFLPRLLKDHHNISATSYDLHLKDTLHSSRTRTIICIPRKGYRSVGIVDKFSSLRILHVLRGSHHSDWEPGQVFDLIHLSYLASNIPSSIVPQEISKLQNLQTLNIYRSEVLLPVEIWRLRQLRHLIALSFQPLPQPEGEAPSLENLQTLSLAKDLVCSKRMVEMIPNIQKLGICYSKEKFDESYHQLNNLKHLSRLEKLKLEMRGGFSFRLVEKLKLKMVRCFTICRPSVNLAFPLLLKKLTLSGWRLPWSYMGIIGSLPNLQVLKLRNHAFEGKYWRTTRGEFGELRVLLIDKLDLHDWRSKSSHLPKLERLMLHRCPHLSKIPSSFGDIPTLGLIEVDQASILTYSAQSILQKQLQSGNHRLQVRSRPLDTI